MADQEAGTVDTTGTPAAANTDAPAAVDTTKTTDAPAAKTDTQAAPTKTDPPAKTEPAEAAEADPDDQPVKDGDWAVIREKIAKGDPKVLARLSRYSSIESVAEALIAAQNRIASGELKAPLPKDATPEQLAEWREANGIPSDPKDYDLTMPDGLIIGEEDQPVVDEFVKHAHEQNLTPEQVKANVAWYLGVQEQVAEQQAEADLTAREQGEEAVRELWGTETRLNKQMVVNFINTAPDGAGDLILGARLADGTPLASNPAVLRWLADSARAINPVATVVPGSGSNAAQAIETELANLTKMMGDHSSEYWKGPSAAKNQERYRQLVDVQSRMKA